MRSIIGIVCFLLLAPVGVIAQGHMELFKQAAECYDQNKMSEGFALHLQAIQSCAREQYCMNNLIYTPIIVDMAQKAGQYKEALEALDIAERKSANYYTVLIKTWRADLFRLQGKFPEALAEYEKAVSLSSRGGSSEVDLPFIRLAWMKSTCKDAAFRNGREAMELLEKATTIDNKKEKNETNHELLNTYAAAYAELGDFENAIEKAQAGKWREENVKQLEAYKLGKPWRE